MAEENENTSAVKKLKKRRARSNASVESAKRKPWTFPKNTLEDAIAIPKAIEEKNAGNPMPAADLAKAVGFKQAERLAFSRSASVRESVRAGDWNRRGGGNSYCEAWSRHCGAKFPP